MIDSDILFVTICSNGKVQGPNQGYDLDSPLGRLLPSGVNQVLLKNRRRVYALLRNWETERQHLPLAKHPYNQGLRNDGPDYGGGERLPIYLPAISRYDGRFYRALDRARDEQLANPRHHLLIVSGLYGLVAAGESIQLYSLHVPDHEKVTAIWGKEGVLTRILRTYIKQYDIARVFDLCGVENYRSLVDWDALDAEVLHAFGNLNASGAVLSALGGAARVLLRADGEELLTLPSGYTMDVGETVVLTTSRQPPEGYPREGLAPDDSDEAARRPQTRANVQIRSPNDHKTVFGQPVRGWEDIPEPPRGLLLGLTGSQYVQEIRLGKFHSDGQTREYDLRLEQPEANSSRLYGELSGPGKIGCRQDVEIIVEKGHEARAFQEICRNDPRIKRR